MRTAPGLMVALILSVPLSGFAWGEKAHVIINRAAIQAASSKLPEFMNTDRELLIFNGYEPDRWRTEGRSPMNIAQEVDHYFDSERWGSISTLPTDRYAFL